MDKEREAIVVGYAKTARAIAIRSWREWGRCIEPDEAIGVANLALVESVARMDLSLNWRDWLGKRIGFAVLDYIRSDQKLSRLDNAIKKKGERAEALTGEHAPVPDRVRGRPAVLRTWSREASDRGAGARRSEALVDVRRLVGVLNRRKRRIIAWRRLMDMSQKEIGAKLGITAMRVCQLEREALGKMRGVVGATEPARVTRKTIRAARAAKRAACTTGG